MHHALALALPSSALGRGANSSGATLALDFQRSQYSTSTANFGSVSNLPGWSFTRASVGWAKDSLGNDVQFLSGVPRITDLGLLIEESRTNFLLNSTAPVTQTTGSLATGSYTLWIVGSGSAAITAGTGTATGLGTATAASPVTITVTVAGTFTVTNTGSVTFFQLENGAVQTSRIVTAGATATRAADAGSNAVTVNAGQDFTIFAQANMGAITGVIQTVAYLNDGSPNNRVILRRNADDSVSLFVTVSGATTQVANVASKGGARTLKVAVSRAGSAYTLAVDGAIINSGSVSSMPMLTTVQLGTLGVTDFLNAPLQRLVLSLTASSNAQLQALTQ